MDQTFFGLSKTHRARLHEQIFDILWAGQGRWSWTDIYHMPIPMRQFWVQRINDKIIDAKTPKTNKTEPSRPPKNKTL